MATNDFVPFATGTGANTYSTASYQASNARLLGVVDGEADPKLANNAWRQPSVIGAMIGSFIAAQGFDAFDDGNLANLLTSFRAALDKTVGAQFPSRQRIHFGSDTGVANRIVADVSPDILTYETGAIYWVLAANAPTGPAVASLDGRGDRNIVRRDGTAIQANDWRAGEVIELRDDGDRLQLGGALAPASGSLVYRGSNSGTVNALVADVSPNPTNYETNAIYVISLAGPNTGPVTANLEGLGVRTVVRSNGKPLRPGDISRVAALTYDGTNLVLLNLAQEIAPPGSAFAGGQSKFAFQGSQGVPSVLQAAFTVQYAGVVIAFSTLNSSPENGNIQNTAVISVNGTPSSGATDTIVGASTSIINVDVRPGDNVVVTSTVIPASQPPANVSQYLRYQFAPG